MGPEHYFQLASASLVVSEVCVLPTLFRDFAFMLLRTTGLVDAEEDFNTIAFNLPEFEKVKGLSMVMITFYVALRLAYSYKLQPFVVIKHSLPSYGVATYATLILVFANFTIGAFNYYTGDATITYMSDSHMFLSTVFVAPIVEELLYRGLLLQALLKTKLSVQTSCVINSVIFAAGHLSTLNPELRQLPLLFAKMSHSFILGMLMCFAALPARLRPDFVDESGGTKKKRKPKKSSSPSTVCTYQAEDELPQIGKSVLPHVLINLGGVMIPDVDSANSLVALVSYALTTLLELNAMWFVRSDALGSTMS